MASVMTHADSLRLYLTGASSHFGTQTDPNLALGNHQSSTEQGMTFNVTNPISSITVDYVGFANGAGAGTLTATGNDTLKWTPPGASQGANVTILNGESKVIEGADLNKYIRVSRTSATALSGTATLTLSQTINNVFGFDDLSSAEQAAGDTEYRAVCVENVSAVTLTGVKVYLATQGTRQTTNTTQLPASGAGTVKTTGNFNDWPSQGFAQIRTSGDAIRESIYYTSRTADELTVPAAGRALQGTSAAAGSATDTVDAIPGIAIGIEAPGSQPSGAFQTVANESTAPGGGVTFSQPITAAAGLNIGNLAANNIYAVWMRRVSPAGATANSNQLNGLKFAFDAS